MAKKLQGRWQLDLESLVADAAAVEGNPLADLGRGLAQAFIERSGAKIEIVFHPSGTYTKTEVAMGKEQTEHGQWKIVGADGQQVTVHMKADQEQEFRAQIITFLDDDHVQIPLPDGNQTAKFKRVPESS